MKTPDQELKELRREVEQLKREMSRYAVRPAAPLAPRYGRFLGITREDFTKGTDEFFEVDVWIWSETDQDWRKVPNLVIQARDWFLDDDEEVQRQTKVKIEWYETTWVVTAMYCSPVGEDSEFYSSPGAELAGDSSGGFGGDSYAAAYSSPGYTSLGFDAGAMTWQD